MRIYVKAGRNDQYILNKVQDCRDEIHEIAKEVMQSPEFGFLPEELEHYLRVPCFRNDPYEREYIIEVYAEVDYDGMITLEEALNPILQKYDREAYFEQVEPGVMQAFLEF